MRSVVGREGGEKMKNERGTDLPVKLAAPARRALAQASITRLDQLAKLSEAELGKLHGIGPNAVRLLAAALKEHGFSFRA